MHQNSGRQLLNTFAHPSPILSDGSDRRFFRTRWGGKAAVVILPQEGAVGAAEARSYWKIGGHLRGAGLPVPEIYLYDRESGTVVVEDLGDAHLHGMVLDRARRGDWKSVEGLYRKALRTLVRMQIKGGEGFDPGWCHDTPRYDGRLALEREARYFLRFFVQRLCGRLTPAALEAELEGLALRVDGIQRKDFFLHRDFQSRNILVRGQGPWIIDFQGGRLGPLGYDPAALLHDPYVSLPGRLRSALLDFYWDEVRAGGAHEDPEAFRAEFRLLGLLRTLQVLGAYSFLHLVKGKRFFSAYIAPALSNLHAVLSHSDFDDCPGLRALASSLLEHPPTHAA